MVSLVLLGVWTVNAASLRDFERQLEEEIRREEAISQQVNQGDYFGE